VAYVVKRYILLYFSFIFCPFKKKGNLLLGFMTQCAIVVPVVFLLNIVLHAIAAQNRNLVRGRTFCRSINRSIFVQKNNNSSSFIHIYNACGCEVSIRSGVPQQPHQWRHAWNFWKWGSVVKWFSLYFSSYYGTRNATVWGDRVDAGPPSLSLWFFLVSS
jgi:hypothetical protein